MAFGVDELMRTSTLLPLSSNDATTGAPVNAQHIAKLQQCIDESDESDTKGQHVDDCKSATAEPLSNRGLGRSTLLSFLAMGLKLRSQAPEVPFHFMGV